MQTVQRAEFWGAIVALQAYWPCHLGIDNLDVARTTGRLLDKDCLVKPLPLVKDGDLVALVQYMIRTRGRETVRVTRLKDMLRTRMFNMVGFGWKINWGTLRLMPPLTWVVVISLKFSLMLGVACFRLVVVGTTVMIDLHRFMVTVARVTVNHDGGGGTAPDPLIWDQGGRRKVRRTDIRVNVDLASLPGPPGFLGGPWIQVRGSSISGADIAAWPNCVGIL